MLHLDDDSLTIAGVERHLDAVDLTDDRGIERPYSRAIDSRVVVLEGLVLRHAFILPRAVRGVKARALDYLTRERARLPHHRAGVKEGLGT